MPTENGLGEVVAEVLRVLRAPGQSLTEGTTIETQITRRWSFFTQVLEIEVRMPVSHQILYEFEGNRLFRPVVSLSMDGRLQFKDVVPFSFFRRHRFPFVLETTPCLLVLNGVLDLFWGGIWIGSKKVTWV